MDEVLTPDSSRFWPADQYQVGTNPPSFDKQFVRDWLEQSGWNKKAPAPDVPSDVIQKTVDKILEINKLGNVALITDGRFPNELKGVSELNGITIQLDISKEKQIENLLNRDGILPNKEAFNHPSETSYLEYKDFDLILTEDILSDKDLILSKIKKTIDNKVKI